MIPKWAARNGWTKGHLLTTATLLVGAAVATTWDAWLDIGRIALRDEEMSHILLVPLMVAWLIWVRRRRLRLCRPVGTMIGPVLVAAGWLLYTLGDRLLVQSAWHLGAIVVVTGCLLSVLGWPVLWRFMPAFVALVFLVPVPGTIRQQIAIPLQNYAAVITQNILEVVGTSVERSGNLLIINGVDVAIAEACNGLRMVFALTLVSYVFAFGTPLRNYVRVLIVLASPAIALGLNIVRLCLAVWVYGYYSASLADAYHTISGWLMLPLALLLLTGIMRLLRWALIPVTPYALAVD